MKSKAEELRDAKYYGLAHEGSTDLTHPAMKILLKIFRKSSEVLDMGCGEGTRLSTLLTSSKKVAVRAFGVDASALAIKLARKKYPQINFQIANLEKLPFKDSQFNLLYSAYVFEHLINPEIVLKESLRILKKEGRLMLIAPNFGAPNRRSPNSKENKITKLIQGLINDFYLLFSNKVSSLNWQSVTPMRDKYTIDADTTVEPYLLSLIKYCQYLGFKVEYTSTNWSVDRFSFFQFVFRILGSLKIPPFLYWGPHLSIILRK